MGSAFDAVFLGKPMPEYSEGKDEVAELVDDDEAETPEEKPQETPIEQPETKPDAKPDETKAEPEEDDKPVKVVPHAALHAQRERTKQLEQEIAQLRQQQQPKPTSVLDDEDKAFNERIQPLIAAERQARFEMSVEWARERPGREDYDEVYEFMNAEIQEHPELMQSILSARNPGETIYTLGKTRKELAAVGGDLTKYRDHVTKAERDKLTAAEARIKALEAEIATAKASKEKRAAIPQSTNADQSGSVQSEEFAGPTPLKKVFS